MPELLTFLGCSPAPLASYLKALGVLRLISSDANHVSGRASDLQARGWWNNECFHLRTTLDHNSLLEFFLRKYAPSPIIAPWNGRAGFLEGDEGAESSRTGAELMNTIQSSASPRFAHMRRTVELLRSNEIIGRYDQLRANEKRLKKDLKNLEGYERLQMKKELKKIEKQVKECKSWLLPTLRATTDRDHLAYIDTCYVLSADEAAAPLLGSGGNDGSRDFGVNFAECLKKLFGFDNGLPSDRAKVQLEAALFDTNQRLDVTGSMGQFTPGQGGANATTGYKGYSPLNVWDVVLAMEGTMVFAGTLTRRWGAAGGARGAFPFTFEPIRAGAGNLSSADPNRPRGEVWIPLWRKPATFSEIAATFAEGRLTLGRRAARTGLDAARSVARIAQSRGIDSFERYSFVQPDSNVPFQATPLGRFNAPDRSRRDPIDDLEVGDWLQRARRLVGNVSAPAHARSAMRRLEDALFQMTDAKRVASGTRNALMALGGFVGWLATNFKAHEELSPPPLLSPVWTIDADDGSSEFRVAAALAGLGLPASRAEDPKSPRVNTSVVNDAAPGFGTSKAPPMAGHFAPIDEEGFSDGQRLRQHRRWAASAVIRNVVWGAGSFVSNMTAVLERRLVDASTRRLDDKPLDGATCAGLGDVAAFLSGDFDDARCAALLAGLIWARPERLRLSHADRLPFAYAALKPIFTPNHVLHRIGAIEKQGRLPTPPGLVTRLCAAGASCDGRVTDLAVRTALARCRGSGLLSPFDSRLAGGRASTKETSRIGAGVRADRLAASLLIPIGDQALLSLIDRVYPARFPEDEDNTQPKEDITDAT